MFSSLAKGNGSWNGHLEEKSTLDNLFPSIYQASIPSDATIPSPDTFGLSKTQDHALQLPKTYITRKGAIVLFAAQNGKHNEREKQLNENDENYAKPKDGILLQDFPSFKSSGLSQSSPRTEGLDQIQEQMPAEEKRKLLLEFLDVFLKDSSENKRAISPTTNEKPKSKQDHEEDQIENVLKVLSRPHSITSFYHNSHHEALANRQKARPKTVSGNVIPKEPEHLKAHPRITSAKPRPPTRALGKLPSKNTRSGFDKEKTSYITPPVFVTRQVKTPNCSTTNELVHEDRISIPRSERASRAASSMSRYSSWWATDDVSLSYYDNELRDADDEYPECIECLSEQRSEIGRMPMSDIETDSLKQEISSLDIQKSEDSTFKLNVDAAFAVEEGNEKQCTLQNWASKRNPQQQQAKLNASSTNSTAGFSNIDSQTLSDVFCKTKYPGQTNKSRVKSAPCLAKRKESKYSRIHPRKYFSAGPNRSRTPTLSYGGHETDPPKNQEETYNSIRIPSTVCSHDNNDDDETVFVSKDFSEKPTFTEGTQGNSNSGVSKDICDIISTDQALSTIFATSSPVSYFVPHGEEGSGHIVEPNTTKDGIGVDTFDYSVKMHGLKISTKNVEQDKGLESDVIRHQESGVIKKTYIQQNVDKEVHPDQALSSTKAISSAIAERQDKGGVGRQKEIFSSVSSVVLSPEVNHRSKDGGEFDEITHNEQKALAKATEFEETISVGSVDGGYVAKDKDVTDLLHELPSSFASEDDYKVNKIEDPSETNLKIAALNETTDSAHEAGTEIKELPETNLDDLTEASKPGHLDVCDRKVQESSGTDLNTDDSNVREIKLLSQTNFATDEIIGQKTETHYSNIVQSSNVEDTVITASTNSVFMQQESSDGQQNAVISAPKLDDNSRTKLKLDENSTTKENNKNKKVKTEKTKREKLDIQGVGKADEKMKETKVKMEIKKADKITGAKDEVEINIKNKVDLSALVAKKASNKTIKKPTLGKTARSPKTRRKNIIAPEYTPELEPSFDVIPSVDEDLLNMIDNLDGDMELSEETLNQFAPMEDFQDPGALSVLEDISIETTDAFSPSKVKKGGKKTGGARKKKGRVVESDVAESQERKKMAEEKAKQEEEMKLLQEREEEQMRSMEEAKEKQRTIEEEKDKRLAQETEARKQQETAEQALKEAKRKAKEEREKRREVEAERRKMEVQRKREEKRKREVEIQKREEELEKQREDRDLKMEELQAQKERELELERIAEEERKEEERLRLLQLDEEKRQDEEKIREAEEAVQRMAREREYREQMRKIAEAQQAKLEKQEIERRTKEEQERAAIEEERARLEHETQIRENEEQQRVHNLRQKDAIARIRAAHEATKRRAWALRRRAQNTERMSHLRYTRHAQKLTEAFTFSYHVQVPREVWELPYDWNSKKKRGNRPLRKKQNGEKKP